MKLNEFDKDVEGIKLVPQERLSPSSINVFLSCPRQYFLTYIAKLKVKPSIHLVKGSIVHRALELFFKAYPKSGTLQEFLFVCFDKAWEENIRRVKDLELPQEEENVAKEDCLGMVTEYFISYSRKIEQLIKVGKASEAAHAYYLLKPKFREKFLEDKNMHVCGYIDRVSEDFDGILTLGDYKTSAKYGIGIPEDYKRQLSIYALLYTNIEKRQPDFVAVDFLRYGETYFLEVTPSLLQFARNVVTDVYAKTRSVNIDDYPLTEGRLCKFCSYNDICSGQASWEDQMRKERLTKVLSGGVEND